MKHKLELKQISEFQDASAWSNIIYIALEKYFFLKAFLHLEADSKDGISNEGKHHTNNIKVYSHGPTKPSEPGECSSHTPEPEGT